MQDQQPMDPTRNGTAMRTCSRMQTRSEYISRPGRWFAAVCLVSSCLTACGGAKVLEEPVPLEVKQPLAIAADERLATSLDWIIFRDGPGAWARDVDWDEYLMRVQNLSDQTMHITNVVVRDSLGTPVEHRGSYRGLVRGTRLVGSRYKEEGLEVHAGAGSEAMLATGVVVGAVSYEMTMSYVALREVLGFNSAVLGSGMAGLFVVTPALIAGSVQRSKDDRAIAREIGSRQTPLPASLAPGEGKNVDFFFPVTPSPREIEITYVDADGEHRLIIDTRRVLDGLHLREAG